ncbi:RNA-binding S4 domain-containing protein [Psychromonas antarctica]|uniref:RNA-binding S4 domain-containing protein n=1 Tax=Psychromonas antarctica TaxID=67573 RepID=UPI001EE99BF9|nr:RNA-binding S4 domain-containing protein [Psychromonas antarctica]MCG6200745.1 RNA-binding S4 domain-containing protein [Psychromonas antarctica]
MTDKKSQQMPQSYATLIEIKQEPTELCKILKLESLVSGGGEAKLAISEGYVLLNGEVETRKRKKVYAGDLLTFNGQHYQIVLQGQTQPREFVLPLQDPKMPAAEIEQVSAGEHSENVIKTKKARRAISF